VLTSSGPAVAWEVIPLDGVLPGVCVMCVCVGGGWLGGHVQLLAHRQAEASQLLHSGAIHMSEHCCSRVLLVSILANWAWSCGFDRTQWPPFWCPDHGVALCWWGIAGDAQMATMARVSTSSDDDSESSGIDAFMQSITGVLRLEFAIVGEVRPYMG
jgi:hypothetical protein